MTDKTTLNRHRRDAVHQIICRRDINPSTKIVARNVAALEFVSDTGSSTSASDMTIARKAGVKLHEATAAIKELSAAHQLKIDERDGKRRLHLFVCDGNRPPVSIIACGDTKFFQSDGHRDHIRAREGWLDRVFSDRRLTNSDKLIAYAFLTLTDPHTLRQTEGLQTIAGIVRYSKSTASRSIQRLIESSYLADGSTVALGVADPLQPGCSPVAGPLQAKCGSAHLTAISDPPSGDSGFSGNSVDSEKCSEGPSVLRPRSGERGGRRQVRFARDEVERLAQLADLIHDNSNGADFKTMAGIMAVSGAIDGKDYPGNGVGTDVYDEPYYPDEIQKFVRAGLLARDGQRISVTPLGWRYINWIQEQEEQAA